MAHIAKLRLLLVAAFGPAIALLLLLTFAGYVVLGSNGVLAWGDYSRQLHGAKLELKKTQQARAELIDMLQIVGPEVIVNEAGHVGGGVVFR